MSIKKVISIWVCVCDFFLGLKLKKEKQLLVKERRFYPKINALFIQKLILVLISFFLNLNSYKKCW